ALRVRRCWLYNESASDSVPLGREDLLVARQCCLQANKSPKLKPLRNTLLHGSPIGTKLRSTRSPSRFQMRQTRSVRPRRAGATAKDGSRQLGGGGRRLLGRRRWLQLPGRRRQGAKRD